MSNKIVFALALVQVIASPSWGMKKMNWDRLGRLLKKGGKAGSDKIDQKGPSEFANILKSQSQRSFGNIDLDRLKEVIAKDEQEKSQPRLTIDQLANHEKRKLIESNAPDLAPGEKFTHFRVSGSSQHIIDYTVVDGQGESRVEVVDTKAKNRSHPGFTPDMQKQHR